MSVLALASALDWRALVGTLLGRIAAPAAAVDANGMIRCANQPLAQLLGVEAADLSGVTLFRPLPLARRHGRRPELVVERQHLRFNGIDYMAWVKTARIGSHRIIEVKLAVPLHENQA